MATAASSETLPPMPPPTAETAMRLHSTRLLRIALLGNAAFSLTTGTLLALFAQRVGALIAPSLPPSLFAEIGVALLFFGLLTGSLGLRSRPETWWAVAISIADLGWVVGSAALLLLAPTYFSALGLGSVAVVALIVLGFAIGQLLGINRVYAVSSRDPNSPAYRVCLEVASSGQPEKIWSNLADLGGIERYSPMLAFSRMRDSTTGVGAIRECGDHAGRQWAERCQRLDHERREIELVFLTEKKGFPFPFSTLRGGWSVQPAAAGGGAVIRVWLEGTPRPRLLAPVILPLLEWQSRRTFPATIHQLAGFPAIKSRRGSSLLAVTSC